MAIPETPITRQEMYLDAIAKNAGGGGGSALPSVTSADNGKVLGVVDGAWAAEDKRFVVNITQASQSSGTMDKTPEEVYSAYMANKDIVVSVNTFPGVYICPSGFGIVGNAAMFSCLFVHGINNVYYLYLFDSAIDSQSVQVAAFPLGS